MRIHLLHLSAVLFPLLAIGCPSETPALCDNGACEADGGNPDGSSSGGDGGSDVIVPDGCDLTKDPKDSPNCVASEVGIFVDAATGNDGNSGSKELPVKTIAGAQAKLAGRPRIYVCEGTYAESVKLTSPVSLYGGFACTSWEYTGTKPKIAPSARSVALSIAGVSSAIVVADIEATSPDASEAGESSIAVFVANASNVTLRRVTAIAGTGMDGTDASNQADFSPAVAPDGTGGANGGAQTVNSACPTSIGGAGANDTTHNGADGKVAISPVYPARSFGTGGTGGALCGSGGTGIDGSYGVAGPSGAGATSVGTIDADGWKGADGAVGGKGGDGQGGGGGAQKLLNSGGVGGSGGPGGCGGAGGGKGTAGGSSIALVLFQSSALLEQSSLTAKDAGRGGNGAKGQKAKLASPNQATGNGANGCAGGFGGVGGSGGGGGGGAGGISAGVVYKGTAPKLDGAQVSAADTHESVTLGQKGAAGLKGAGGDPAQTTPPASRPGTDGTDGVAGEAKAIFSVP